MCCDRNPQSENCKCWYVLQSIPASSVWKVLEDIILHGGLNQCFAFSVFQHPVFVTAQVLSFIAIFFSWGFWLTGLLGFTAFTMLQLTWCCKLNKCALITAGVFACFTEIGCAIESIVLFLKYADDEGYYYNPDDGFVLYVTQEVPSEEGHIYAAICLIGALLWTVVSVCLFVFAFGRFQRYQQQELNKDATESDETDDEISVVVIPVEPEKILKGGEPTGV